MNVALETGGMGKGLAVLFLCYACALDAAAQNVGINTDGATPDPSALLDLDVSALDPANKRGLLVPRMDETEMLTIPAPATSLLVFNTTANAFYWFDGMAWVPLGGGGAWQLTGNTGTSDGANFLGTTDNVPLNFRVNGEPAGRIESNFWADTFFGHGAGLNSPNQSNTGIGKEALGAITMGGWENTATGAYALRNNSSGSWNTAMGARTLFSNTSGSWNTAQGNVAMLGNTTGSLNTALGNLALHSSIAGSRATAVGARAMQNANNTATPFENTNVAVGFQALRGSFSPGDNTGLQNTALGYEALLENSGGEQNTATGYRSLHVNTTGSGNSAFGHSTLVNNTGDDNTAMGSWAWPDYVAGSRNTALGLGALYGNSYSGNDNTAIGAGAGTNADLTGTIAVGYNATANADYRAVIGTIANTNLTGGFGAWQNLSDGRFKRNVREDVPGLEFITRLRPVTYTLDAHGVDAFLGIAQRMDTLLDYAGKAHYRQRLDAVAAARQTGFIAQEVEQAALHAGYSFSGVHRPATETDHYTLGYATFTVPLVKSVQELHAMVLEQRQEEQLLHAEIAVLREEITRLRLRIARLEQGGTPLE